jgi:hypothetical protein
LILLAFFVVPGTVPVFPGHGTDIDIKYRKSGKKPFLMGKTVIY